MVLFVIINPDVPGDGTNSCAFLSVVFGDHLLCQNERLTVITFEEIACLVEEVIIDSPLQFNPFCDKSRHYDVFCGHKTIVSEFIKVPSSKQQFIPPATEMREDFYTCASSFACGRRLEMVYVKINFFNGHIGVDDDLKEEAHCVQVCTFL